MKVRFNILLKSLILIAVITAGLVLAQMWFHPFAWAVFWKLIVTLVILGGLVSFILAVKEDIGSEKNLRDDKYLS